MGNPGISKQELKVTQGHFPRNTGRTVLFGLKLDTLSETLPDKKREAVIYCHVTGHHRWSLSPREPWKDHERDIKNGLVLAATHANNMAAEIKNDATWLTNHPQASPMIGMSRERIKMKNICILYSSV